jgi:hypothetical protein
MDGLKTVVPALLCASALVLATGAFATARSPRPDRAESQDEPVLIKATFFSHTNDDDKDHDTGIYVHVKTHDGSSLIAHADNRDNSGDDGTQYKDNSDHQFDLDIDAAGMEKKDAQHFNVHVCQHTHGNDTWKMHSRVVLYFSNKTNLVASSGDVTLKNDGACTDYSS